MTRLRDIHYRVFGATHAGKKRENNEDHLVLNKKIGFFAVADGMGGHAGGEIASRKAVEISEDSLGKSFKPSKDEDTLLPDVQGSDEDRVMSAIQKAHRNILEENEQRISATQLDPPNPVSRMKMNRAKMGTTFVCIKMLQRSMLIANVGDSRCYLFRGGRMQRLTIDHSTLAEKQLAGTMPVDSKERVQLRDYITSSIGYEKEVDPDISVFLPQAGDVYLLCSDGLTKMVPDEKIAEILLGETEVRNACRHLVAMANEMGGRDNITVILLQITGVETRKKGVPRKSSQEDTLLD